METRMLSRQALIMAVSVLAMALLACNTTASLFNRPPIISENAVVSNTTESNMLQEIVGVTTKITIKASDPDRDPLTYAWTASNGSITGNGATGIWKRVLVNGDRLVPGTATVVVTDGRGGQAKYTFTAK